MMWKSIQIGRATNGYILHSKYAKGDDSPATVARSKGELLDEVAKLLDEDEGRGLLDAINLGSFHAQLLADDVEPERKPIDPDQEEAATP